MAHIAPHAGARIETAYHLDWCLCRVIAPHAGARIETDTVFDNIIGQSSHLTQVRGLKRNGSD